MRWKSWPYWVKGGVIGFGVAILFDVYAFYYRQELFSEYPQCSIPGESGGSCPLIFDPALMYRYLIFSTISKTLLGLIIGYLYGKFKTRQRPPISGNSA
jgi:hypothetical protein